MFCLEHEFKLYWYTAALLKPVTILLYCKTCFLFLSDVAADATVSVDKANPLAEERSLVKGIYIISEMKFDTMYKLNPEKIMEKQHRQTSPDLPFVA